MKKILEIWIKLLNALAAKGTVAAALVGLIPALLVFYGGYSLLIAPARTTHQDQLIRVRQIEAEVAKARTVEANEAEFKREFKRVVQLFYDSLPMLPKETELSSVFDNVQDSAQRYNVLLTGLSTTREANKTPNADKLYERELTATVVGKFDDVMRFFMDVSKKTRIMIVRDYEIQSVREKSAANRGATRPTAVSVKFALLAFHAPPTNEFPALPADLLPVTNTETVQDITSGGFQR